MKRKLTIILLAFVAVLSAAFVACDNNAHTHTLEKVGAVSATCQTTGNIEYYRCTGCDKLFLDETNTETTEEQTVVAALNHDVEHHDAKAATCTEDGWNAYDTCKREGCEYTTKVVIPAAHTEVVDNAKAATCTVDGLTEGKHCSACEEVLVVQETVKANGHDYKETVVEPIADANGYVLHKCSVCQDEYKDGYFNYFRFEAENAISNSWNDGTDMLWKWNNKPDTASNGWYVGHISDCAIHIPGQAYMLFVVNAEEATTASLYASLGFGESPLASTAFTVTVNGVNLDKLGNENGEIVAIDANYKPEWEVFALSKLSDAITLHKGENVILITVNSGATCNMDYIELKAGATLTYVAVEHTCESRCPVCGKCKDTDCTEYSCAIQCACKTDTYRFEAENAASNAWDDGTNMLWKWNNAADISSNGWYVGHISDSAIDKPGESWMSFTFNSNVATSASLSMCLTLPEGFIVNTAFTIELNGTVIANVGNEDNKIVSCDSSYENGWMNFTLCSVSNDLNLQEGENILKITVMSGATCNMDYIELTTTATITGNK